MLLHTNPLFFIYFGTAKDNLFQAQYLNLPQEPILTISPFEKLKKVMNAQQLFFAHQVHSDRGIVVDQDVLQNSAPFKSDADFLVTNQPHVGIGVMTADCLPIVFHDKVRNVVAVTHAGWRGAVIGVAVKTVEMMSEIYGSDPSGIAVFFGPSAKVCCYKVGEDFMKNLAGFAYADRVLQQHEGGWFFDLPLFNRIQLEAAGIKKEAFHLDYNICTMCDESFYSHRRQGESAGRQMTVACLT
ncbi:MAG: peptidoglycan editing factor PgeF [Candidatus Babeliales bacterium]|nr:peptidoglycan editing factor PgeF [Candidatus Babeliales bacterium]